MEDPARLGFCSNIRERGDICGRLIYSNCVEYVETTARGSARKTYCCGECVNALLSSVTDSGFTDPAKSAHATKVANSRGNKWAAPR